MVNELIYVSIILLDVFFLNFFSLRGKSASKRMVRKVREMIAAISVCMVTCMCAILLDSTELAEVFQSLHYISTEWMLISFLLFLEVYGCKIPLTKLTKAVLMVYAGANSVSILLNSFFHHVFTAHKVEVNGLEVNAYETYAPFYDFHFYFSAFLYVLCLYVLVWGVRHMVKLYRQKYLYSLIVLIITFVCEAVCYLMKYTHDFAILGYALTGFFFLYYALYYKPRSVITNTLAYVVEDSKNGVICFDPEDKCIYINDVVLDVLKDQNLDMEKLGQQFLQFMGIQTFRESQERHFCEQVTIRGEKHYIEVSFARLFDDNKNYTGAYFTLNDKTEDQSRLEKERYKANHDSLTGLYNKDCFYEQIQHLIKENPEQRYTIVTMDIRDFKLINDVYGYDTGNELLVRLGKKLQESLPEAAVCARLVADHFALCIPKEEFDERYLKADIMDMRKIMENAEFTVYVHAGIYDVQPEDTDVSLMCDRANMALRTIKNDYNILVSYYDDSMMNRVLQSKHMISEFDAAIEERQFQMYLQPQVDASGKVLGAEALVRWKHPEKGMISPGEFIPIFEECGLIPTLDLYIWEEAARKLQEWKRRGNEEMHISVNISARDFFYLDIYECFTGLVEKYEINPRNLKLEITETALMQDLDKQLELLSRLQGYGFHVEIDDFGSGYSSLNMLKNIQADVLKIDMGFLREIKNHNRTKIILGMVVDLAKQLEMTVITEGVETREQVDYLIKVGCDMFQGYYFARPVCVDEFEEKYYACAAG